MAKNGADDDYSSEPNFDSASGDDDDLSSFDWSQIPDTSSFQDNRNTPTMAYQLHPDDRIWRHPSEAKIAVNSNSSSPDSPLFSLKYLVISTISSSLIAVIVTTFILSATLSRPAVDRTNDRHVKHRIQRRVKSLTRFVSGAILDCRCR